MNAITFLPGRESTSRVSALFAGRDPRVASSLSTHGYPTAIANTVDAGLSLLDSAEFGVMVTELDLSEEDAFQLCRRALEKQPELVVVLIAPAVDMDTAVAAMRAGASDLLMEPIELGVLGRVVDDLVHRHRFRSGIQRLAGPEQDSGHPAIIGNSVAVRAVVDLVKRIALSDATVLISGESGTGKELVARAIHETSERCGPFVPVNCGTMPEPLLESELFGPVSGAFTGANAGTVFLDEIGEMPLTTQMKLLRALEVGGTNEDGARIVAATNKHLETEVSEGRFREDLYYRINVVRVDMPPLREREGDILLLSRMFLQRAALRTRKSVADIAPQAIEKLLAYPFPGNVRELSNAIERGVALARSNWITPDDLPRQIREHTHRSSMVPTPSEFELRTMRQVEVEYIQHVLETVGGNKTRAARILGVDRRTLYRKIESAERRAS